MGEWKSLKIETGTGVFKELYRLSGSGAFKELLWEVDVGLYYSGAGLGGSDKTYIGKDNPANENSYLTNIQFHKGRTGNQTIYFGCFYVVSGNRLKCRSATSGFFTGTGEKNHSCEIEIHEGDYIGAYDMYYISYGSTGDGIWYVAGNKCVVNNETTYDFFAPRKISALGT